MKDNEAVYFKVVKYKQISTWKVDAFELNIYCLYFRGSISYEKYQEIIDSMYILQKIDGMYMRNGSSCEK
jgi:hypothetical protein